MTQQMTDVAPAAEALERCPQCGRDVPASSITSMTERVGAHLKRQWRECHSCRLDRQYSYDT